MRILELNFEKHWRGGERQTIYGIHGFNNAGHEITLLCRKGTPLEVKAKANALNVISCSGVISVLSFIFFKGMHYDILHCQTSNMLTWCIITKWWHRKPVVLSRRVSYIPKGYFTLFKYRCASKVIAISNAVKSILKTQGIHNVIVIGDVALPVMLNNVRALQFISNYNIGNKRIIATMAAFESEKDPMTMVEAIKLLHAIRKDFVFFHFGSGNLLEEVRGAVLDSGLQNVYYTPGFIEDVTDFFSVIDVFAFSSIHEGSGSSILDAFLYKVPVASTDGGGLRDLITEDRGFICAAKDAKQLANNINKLLERNALVNTMTDNAYAYVTEKHNLDKITSQYLEQFQFLIKREH